MESDARTASQPGETTQPPPKAPNLFQRVGMVYFAPARLGEALRGRSPWFWTLAIVVAVSIALVLLMPAELLMEAAQRGPGGQEGAQQMEPTQLRIFSVIGTLLLFVFAAIVAGVLYLVFNIIFGLSEVGYKQHLSVVAHSWWITLLGSVIAFPLQLAQGDPTLRLGLGLLLADEPSTFVGFFLQNITLFGIWASIAIAAMESGLSRGKVTTGKGAVAVLVLYLLVAAVAGAFQMMGQS